jgi:hypothetical protein
MRRSQPPFDDGSDGEPLKKSSLKPLATDSEDDQPKRTVRRSTEGFSNPRERPSGQKYQPPDWKFPDELYERFDITGVLAQLQKEFSLAALRDSI